MINFFLKGTLPPVLTTLTVPAQRKRAIVLAQADPVHQGHQNALVGRFALMLE